MAANSAKSSNISSYGSTGNVETSFNQELDSYITDSKDNNKDVKHRMWVLGLQARSFGVGQAISSNKDTHYKKSFSTLFIASDYYLISEKYENDFVMTWPAKGNFPRELYNRLNSSGERNMRWSVSFNEKGYSLSDNISVELVNKRTGEVINMVNDDNGGELLAYGSKTGFRAVGGYNTVLFRPNDDFRAVAEKPKEDVKQKKPIGLIVFVVVVTIGAILGIGYWYWKKK